jgi:HK97 family phage portal protein
LKEKRGLFEMIFGRRPREPQGVAQLQTLNGFMGSYVFQAFGSDPYASDVVRSTVHAIASNAAKLKPKHIRRVGGKIIPQLSTIERLLQTRPNPHMNAYDFYYKIVTCLLLKNNEFIFVQADGPNVIGFYPVNYSSAEFLESQGELFLRFRFGMGKEAILPYADIIHLRRHYYDNDLTGESNNKALLPTLELINTTNQGIANAIKSSAHLRGLLKFTQAMMKPEDIKKQRDDFIADYMDVANNGGIAALDAKADYTELKSEPKLINGPQMELIEQKVYKYFNVNKAIVMSEYDEDQWNAFYESVIEPLALQLSLEFTSKLFTGRERGLGHELIWEANRLQYASISTKLSLMQMVDRGALTPNEWREAFNLAPVEGGDKPIRRLDTRPTNEDKDGDLEDGNSEEGNPDSGTAGA